MTLPRHLALGFLLALALAPAAAHGEIKARWLYANIPEDPRPKEMILAAIDRINQKAAGKLKIEVEQLPSIGRDGPNFGTAVRRIAAGEGELSQVSIYSLMGMHPPLELLDLPFLFRDFAHVKSALSGEPGQKLLGGLLPATQGKIRGLALTHTGGFRALVSNQKIRTYEDLKKLKIERIARTYRGPDDPRTTTVRADGHSALGIQLRDDLSRINEMDNYQAGYINAGDDHWGHFRRALEKFGNPPGLWTHFFETRATIFISALVINEKFFQSLSPELKTLLASELGALALEEMETSPAAEEESKRWIKTKNPTTTSAEPSLADRKKMLEAVRPVYEKYEPIFGRELIKSFRSLR